MLNRRQQIITVFCMYVGYAMFMVLRMAPTVAGNPIVDDPSLGVDKGDWGRILAAGTLGAVLGKFIGGLAADRLGGRWTFFLGLVISSLGVAAFALSQSTAFFAGSLFVALMAKSAGWPSMTKIIEAAFRPTAYGRVWGVLSTSSRVGTLIATFALGGLLSLFAWNQMLLAAAATGGVIAVAFFVGLGWAMKNAPEHLDIDQATTPGQAVGQEHSASDQTHPLDGTTLGKRSWCSH